MIFWKQVRMIWILLLLLFSTSILFTKEYFIDDVPKNGIGRFEEPFNNFFTVLKRVRPGDIIWVMPGTYPLTRNMRTAVAGTAEKRIVMKAYDRKQRPVITRHGTVMLIDKGFFTLEGFVFDGQFGNGDIIRINTGGDHTVIRDCEIRNSRRDAIDINEADNVLIENCEIHHLLKGSFTKQKDAHGIVATSQKDLTIRGCNIYYFSGDGFQTDPNRLHPLWDRVLIENCKIWTGALPVDPLPDDPAWDAGHIPGENAVDTKVNKNAALNSDYRPRITIRNTEAFGFKPGFISNRAVFNIKEKVSCQLLAVRVYDSEIAFRLRGPVKRGGAHVTVINSVAYNNQVTFRLENNLRFLKIYNSTFNQTAGTAYFKNVGGGYQKDALELRNCLFIGMKPAEAIHYSNLSAGADFFVASRYHNYHLRTGSPAINAGIAIPAVVLDFEGRRRDENIDIGAFEYRSFTQVPGETPLPVENVHLHQNDPSPFNP